MPENKAFDMKVVAGEKPLNVFDKIKYTTMKYWGIKRDACDFSKQCDSKIKEESQITGGFSNV